MEPAERSAAELLAALQGVLTEVAKPSQVLKVILGQAVEKTGADRGLFVEVNRDGELEYRVLYRFDRADLQGEAGRYSRGILAWVFEHGEPLLIANALEDPRFRRQESVQELRLTSTLCMPVRLGGNVAALIHLESNQPGHFTDEHRARLDSLIDVAAPALAALRAGESFLAERDQLRTAESTAREEVTENRELLANDWSFGRFLGRTPPVRHLERTIRAAARTSAPVLLLGETGTGKSIVARVLHHAGPRARQALVTVFCPSLERGMVETELFGHRRGAFTGAVSDRIGKVQAAERGTLFLDEIGELPPEIQPKLLRLLQEKTYERVGDPTERSADVRIVAATNRDLEVEVKAGRFRRDLYERLNYVPVRIPPLRERREDIPLLLRSCLDRAESGRWVDIEQAALDALVALDFAWPGNVRSIEQLAARIAMEPDDGAVTAARILRLLGPESAELAAVDEPSGATFEDGLPALVALEEKKWIEAAIRRYPGATRAELSEKLKISESALYKKLRQYRIDRPDAPDDDA